MPSVGMRRTTRVFGVVKGIDGARVLRSGRRLLRDSDDYKVKKPLKSEVGWLTNLENKRNSHTGLRSHRHGTNTGRDKCSNRSAGLERTAGPMDVEEGKCDQPELMKKEGLDDRSRDKMFGLVYSRKRKRQNLEDHKSRLEEKKFGAGFIQEQKRCKTMDETESRVVVESADSEASFLRQDPTHCLVLALYVGAYTIKSGSRRSICFAELLFSVLNFLRKTRVSLLQLFRFLMSNPISGVYCSHGIKLLREFPTNSSGICKIFGARQLIPLFSVDFSSVPHCFMYMHLSMLLRYRFVPSIYVYSLVNENVSAVGFSYEKDHTECKTLVSEAADNLGKKLLLHPSVRSSKLASWTAAHMNDVYSRSIQKRRTSLRSRKGRNSPLVGVYRPNGSLMSDLMDRRKSGIPFSSVARSNLERSMPFGNFNETSCDMVGSKQNSVSSCSANILVVESDRCCREEGASIRLEMSDLGEWVLAIKRGGLTRYIHRAQKFLRPSSSNRFTRDLVWTADGGWKLEFPRRQDWVTFKDLYRECFDRNVRLSPTIKAIPVPGVREVSGYGDHNIYTYRRPDSYITMKDDEVSRTLAKKSASYDMDDEDEEWLNKFNDEYFGANKLSEHLTPENFELLIDAYEKAYYCCPDGISDQKTAAKFCSELGQKNVLEVVYCYWMKKRKQKRSALVRVFQVQQSRRASLIPRPALRKKRSFKRQGSQCGRGKQPSQMRVMAAEQSAQEEQNAVQRAQELKASADKSLELAILKRKRAQFLMENADLATYRAAMALKMVEAAQHAESVDTAAACRLD